VAERLAVFGDVHGNVRALDAVLAAIADAGIDDGACTGDLVMRGDEPEACVTRLRDSGWPCVMGNTDLKVSQRPDPDPEHRKADTVGSRAWTLNRLSPTSLAYLGSLPMTVRLTLKSKTVVLMHAGPDDPRAALDAHSSERDLARLVAKLGTPDCIVNGHTHEPLIRNVGGCLFVNPGSVGEARKGDRRPRWAWIEARRSGLTAHLERVPDKLALLRKH
jgi:putative phosphoesterase